MSKSKNVPSGFGWSQGKFSKQPHVHLPQDSYEEEHGRQGFYGRTSHLYHRHPPTGWLRIEGPLKPRAYQATEVNDINGVQFLLENSDVKIGISKIKRVPDFFQRNADGDEVRFIHEGQGVLETDYGNLNYSPGDYLVLPRGVTFRFIPEDANTHLVIESASEVGLPDRGMLGRHAQFDPMVMRIPILQESESKGGKNLKGEYEVHIKRQNEWTHVFYPWNPLNAMGWKGDLSPWALHVGEIRPIISPRYHLPPSVHTTFLGKNFVVCSFLPRPLESEPGALKVPFYHRNIDFDEVLFYHAGQFFSREGIGKGAMTWHPQGIHHGPHPNAMKNAQDKVATEEIAVMIDTSQPLNATEVAKTVEISEYFMSWSADQKK